MQLNHCSDVPHFKNVAANRPVTIRILKKFGSSKLNRLLDWGSPHLIYNKRGGSVYLNSNKDLISAMGANDFNQISDQYDKLYTVADISLKDLDLDLNCPYINFVFQDCQVLLISPTAQGGRKIIQKSIIANHPFLSKIPNITSILQAPNFITKDGWNVAIYI